MLLGVEDLAVAKHVPEKSGRWSRVAISSKGVVATDGYLLVRIGRPKEPLDDDEFPDVAGLPVDGKSEFDEVVIDARDALRLYDAVKKSKMMQLAKVVKHGNYLEGAVADFSSTQMHKAWINTDPWPDTDSLFSRGEVKMAVSFKVELLMKLVKALEAAGVKFIRLVLRSPETGAYFIGYGAGKRTVDGLIMPSVPPAGGEDKWPVTGEKWKGSDAPHPEMPDATSAVETGEEAN